MTLQNAEYYIKHLNLVPHPEGGFYQSTVSSEIEINVSGKQRKLYTSIYFLLRSEDISHLHRLRSDELWYYHGGSSLTVHVIDANGKYEEYKLGLNLEAGEVPQVLVPKNSIFGSSVMNKDTFSLVGCMVAPGFDFEDFELFDQEELLATYPEHEEIINKLGYITK
ncbi:cupin domain-containing protein [Bacillus marasmi]|uniref:cupin domain-containing protein n=1 Tax=Bacillus marasmi TaxID=1926279 RepID=UPI0011C87C54|nr:cupin domain-containing protein [Bacillus marasmi]